MRLPSFQKIWRWFLHNKPSKRSQKGAMTLVSVLLFIAFSTLGLGMIYLSQVYLKMSAFKKNSIILDYASENGVKQGFDQLVHLLSLKNSPSIITEERRSELQRDAMSKGMDTVVEFLEEEIPLILDETWENLRWTSITTFFLQKFYDYEDYFRTIYTGLIDSEGAIENFRQVRYSSLETALEIAIGNIPLSTIPLLVDKPLPQGQKKNFLSQNNIKLAISGKNPIPPHASFSQGELLPRDALPQINEALKIKIFSPQDLSTAQLRAALGLELSNDPVPDGVYLIQDDFGLGGIYVEGDLLEMILAIKYEFQIISFVMEVGQWTLWFSPSEEKTIFFTPIQTQNFDLTPRGIIIVDGAIQSLGGGIIDASGIITMVKDQEIPCVLRGVNLSIVSSDEITLSSHLIHEGVDWQDGVPYIKDSNSQLHIFAAGQDFEGKGESAGQIVMSADSPEDMKIQASLTASGQGITFKGNEKTAHLLGSLQTADYKSNGNELNITFDARLTHNEEFLRNAPKSAQPVMHLFSFKILEWREYE
jgi:hypothetical protein